MKDYTLKEAKEILKEYFNLRPQGTTNIGGVCGGAECDDCLFQNQTGDCEYNFIDENLIKKAAIYIEKNKKKVNWSKVPIGTKVEVWDYDNDPCNCFFFGKINGKLWAVHSLDNNVAYSWEYMRIAED